MDDSQTSGLVVASHTALEPTVEATPLPKYVAPPLVFHYKGGKVLRLVVIEVLPSNHSHQISSPEFATLEHLRYADLKHGIRARVEDSVIADATAPNPGTTQWERDRANRAEAQLRLIEALIMANGGFGYVKSQYGDRQESIPEAITRLCKPVQPLQLEAPQSPGLVLDIDD